METVIVVVAMVCITVLIERRMRYNADIRSDENWKAYLVSKDKGDFSGMLRREIDQGAPITGESSRTVAKDSCPDPQPV